MGKGCALDEQQSRCRASRPLVRDGCLLFHELWFLSTDRKAETWLFFDGAGGLGFGRQSSVDVNAVVVALPGFCGFETSSVICASLGGAEDWAVASVLGNIRWQREPEPPRLELRSQLEHKSI